MQPPPFFFLQAIIKQQVEYLARVMSDCEQGDNLLSVHWELHFYRQLASQFRCDLHSFELEELMQGEHQLNELFILF